MNPDDYQRAGREFFNRLDTVADLSVAEQRFREEVVVLTLFDPTEDQLSAVRRLAGETGVELVIEIAEPDDIVRWAELKQTLIALASVPSNPLKSHPTPQGDYQRPPVEVSLDASGEHVASQLHARFADFVALRVGMFPYPMDRPRAESEESRDRYRRAQDQPPEIDPAEMSFSLDGRLTVPSGFTERHGLLVCNHRPDSVTVETNGAITARVLDPRTRVVVGGFTGFQTMPMRPFRVDAGGTTRIPLIVGTASSQRQLGYRIPPGSWLLDATITYRPTPLNGAHRRTSDALVGTTPPMPFEVLAADHP